MSALQVHPFLGTCLKCGLAGQHSLHALGCHTILTHSSWMNPQSLTLSLDPIKGLLSTRLRYKCPAIHHWTSEGQFTGWGQVSHFTLMSHRKSWTWDGPWYVFANVADPIWIISWKGVIRPTSGVLPVLGFGFTRIAQNLNTDWLYQELFLVTLMTLLSQWQWVLWHCQCQ